MRKQVIIAGCGNIGSRLLQSLARVETVAFEIIGVEPYDSARVVSTTRFEEARMGDHVLSWQETETVYPNKIDLLVVSCDARNRMKALSSVLDKTAPKYVFLEKILFTRPEDFAAARVKLDATGAKTWVNTSRNVWPGYQSLKEKLKDTNSISYKVIGPDWNLGSNAIHFLSVVEYLTGSPFVELSFAPLSPGCREAKRQGYMEVMGTLTGLTERGDTVSLCADPSIEHPISVKLTAGTKSYVLHEAQQRLILNEQETEFPMLHASQLESVFENILREGQCGLPTLEESTRLHIMFFDAIAPALKLKPGDEIPVT